jgi:hypothetical protein
MRSLFMKEPALWRSAAFLNSLLAMLCADVILLAACTGSWRRSPPALIFLAIFSFVVSSSFVDISGQSHRTDRVVSQA